MADDKKKPAAPKMLSAELVAEELAAAMPAAPLPSIELSGDSVRLRYASAELHAARVSADVEALRALPGFVLADSAQADVIPAPGAALAGVVVECLLRRA